MHIRLRGSKNLLTLCQIINKPDVPSLAYEIAEPHPDMNIKVAAFTVSEKSSNTNNNNTLYYRNITRSFQFQHKGNVFKHPVNLQCILFCHVFRS